MRQTIRSAAAAVAVLVAFVACAEGGQRADDVPGKKVALQVAPLSLPGISDACYDFRVTNQSGEVVIARGEPTKAKPEGNGDAVDQSVAASATGGSICASQFGNGAGGDIAYVTPCDASAGSAVHNVTVWVHNLFLSDTVPINGTEWDNPCFRAGGAAGDPTTWTNGCTLGFTCQENQDTSVVFNLVIMRDANQGFFDVAVNFANVFCSGKVDTCDTTGNDTNLLFGASGARVKTAVIAFACSAGPDGSGNENTTLYADDLSVACGSVTTQLDLHGDKGNQLTANDTAGIIQWAIYRGTESLSCGGGNSCNKMYWNTAIALNPAVEAGQNCTITGRFSVGSTEDPALRFGSATFTTPANTRYPVLEVDVNLTTAGAWVDDDANPNDDACVNVSLGNTTAGHRFATQYSEPAGDCFDSRYQSSDGVATRSDPICGWSMVSAGSYDTCGIRGGAAYCWGYRTSSAIPVRVGTDSDWSAISTGMQHMCGIRGGSLYCWGENGNGQLGDGTNIDSSTPVQVAGSGWSKVSAGESHSCGILNGDLFCWGSNSKGQLGDNTNVPSASPVPVYGTFSGGWTDVGTGSMDSCGVSEGDLYCWGWNNYGQLGNGESGALADQKIPVLVDSPPPAWSDVSVGIIHSCGRYAGALYCWGYNGQGQLGDTTKTGRNSPVLVGSDSDWSEVSPGYGHTCGRRGDALYCWGLNNRGQLGDGTTVEQLSPFRVRAGIAWSAISASLYHTCGIATNGDLYCWGSNDYGQLGGFL